ncbi:MAG: hypothetical protein ACXWWC_07750, partial [Chitinophagaceae bacterium]
IRVCACEVAASISSIKINMYCLFIKFVSTKLPCAAGVCQIRGMNGWLLGQNAWQGMKCAEMG